MGTIQHKSHDKTVATIAERNNLNPRTPGMMVLVRDAIGDPYAGSGRAVYRWDEVQASWILMFKDNVETLTFTSESKSISQDKIQLSQVPANGQIWDVMVRDGLVVHQVEYSVAGSVVTIQPDTPGQFDGKQLSVSYAYGTLTQQLDIEIERVVGEAMSAIDKQDTLVSGTNIKTINGKSVLGSGNMDIGGSLQYLTEVRNTTAPNATVPVHGVQATGAEANIDLLLQQKGTGAIVAQVPDGTTAGGNKRGANAVDLQTLRTVNTHVASGQYSVVVGGNSNTASGVNSVVVGGSGNRASGNGAAVVGGQGNTATSNFAFVGNGSINTASGSASTVAGGNANNASGPYSCIGGGNTNTASGNYSTIPGGQYATTNGISGLLAYGFNAGATGQTQMSFWGGRQNTTNDTATRITADAASAGLTNQLAVRNNSAFRVRGTVVARNTSTNDCKEWTFEALIKRGASASTTTIVGTPTIASTFADTAASGWSIDVTADTTNGALAVTAIGEAGKTIRWTCVVHSIEVA